MSQKVTPYKNTSKSKKEQVEDMFDNIAKKYDFLNHFLSLGIDKLWRKRAIKHLKPIQPKIIMDMATGTGDFAIEALQLNPKHIVGLDLSEGMLNIAREKIRQINQTSRIEFVKGDSEKINFTDNTFDAMTVGFGVRNFEYLEKGLSEMYRVLKPNGKLVILEVAKPTVFPLKQLFGLYFNYITPLIGKCFSKDARAYSYLPESVKIFPEGKNFVQILEQIGYKNVKWIPLTFGICAMYTCEKVD